MDDAHLFALALALTGDAESAEELFAAARDAADLRRRAAAWRAARGLPPPPAEPELPAVDGEEAAWARRRRRRAQRLRRLRPWLLAAAAAPLLAALALRLLLPPAPPQGLAAAPAFAMAPIARSDQRDGLSFNVYRVAAGPTRAEVWWELSGQGAARIGRGRQPDLQRPADRRVLPAETSETQAASPDRLLGHSVYHALVTAGGSVNLRLRQTGRRTAWSVSAEAVAADDPLADQITVAESQDGKAWGVTLEAVSLAPSYTAVRFQARGLRANAVLRPELFAADGTPLGWQGFWALGRGGAETVAVFDPLPPGSSQLTVRFPAPLLEPVPAQQAEPPLDFHITLPG